MRAELLRVRLTRRSLSRAPRDRYHREQAEISLPVRRVSNSRDGAGEQLEVTVRYETARRIIIVVVVLFFLISFWQDPEGSADTFTGFVGEVGSFFSAVIDKGAVFVKGLAS